MDTDARTDTQTYSSSGHRSILILYCYSQGIGARYLVVSKPCQPLWLVVMGRCMSSEAVGVNSERYM
jgi:hypothetical protein